VAKRFRQNVCSGSPSSKPEPAEEIPMTPEELFQKKKKAKRESRRGAEEEEAKMGLTSLMDIVAIIVIYLLKSYASDPILIQPVADQHIPMSKVDSPIQEGVAIYISSKELIFNENKLVQLKEGELDPNEVKNHMINALYEKMVEEADISKQMAESRGEIWNGRVIVIGDQNLKFSALVDVMYTAGRAEYSEYAFCVIKAG
jgi:biopolymer transport protein ExbD